MASPNGVGGRQTIVAPGWGGDGYVAWDSESEVVCSPERPSCEGVVAGENGGRAVLHRQQFLRGSKGRFDSMPGQPHVAVCEGIASFRESYAVAREPPLRR